jgi:hypothetical protein
LFLDSRWAGLRQRRFRKIGPWTDPLGAIVRIFQRYKKKSPRLFIDGDSA